MNTDSKIPPDAKRRRRVAAILLSGLVAGGVIAVVVVATGFGDTGTGKVVGTDAPPAPPVLIRTPENPTTSTRARFQYRSAQNSVIFRCRIDGGAYTRCGSAVNYTRLALGAHTFCVRAVDKAGRTSAPTCFNWTIVPASELPFTIRGSGTRDLYPGGPPVPVDLVVTNPNPAAITITSITVRVSGTSAAACAAANFSVTRQLGAAVAVPAHASVSLSALGIAESAWPQLQMLDAGNQEACQRETVYLSFSGTAEG